MKLKRLMALLAVCVLIVAFAGCKKAGEDKGEKNRPAQNQKVTTKETDTPKNNEKQANGKKENGSEVEVGINFLDYRPAVGSKKTFTENGEVVFTEEVIAANDEYVQELLQLGGNVTTQIYRWTKDEVSLLYEEANPENPRVNILPSFEPIEKLETILSNKPNGSSKWKLISNQGEEVVPAGKFTKVLVVESKREEVVNEVTTITRYFAPKQGLIKEKYHQTGKNGFTAVSELAK